jgi:adenylate cyclase
VDLASAVIRNESVAASPAKKKQPKAVPVVHLGPQIKDDMTDEELAVIIESLTTRVENCMSTLVSISFPSRVSCDL